MTTASNRIFWDQEEVLAIAREFVQLRLSDPFASDTTLAVKAMHKALPEKRWRTVNSLAQVPAVKAKMAKLWEEKVTAPSASTAPEDAGPVIITVEVERPVNFAELAERLDGPTIAALAFAKMEKVVAQLNVARVEAPRAAVPEKPPISVLQPTATVRKPRVAVVTLPGQFNDIGAKVATLEDRLDIRYVSNDRNGSRFDSVDYAVILSNSSHQVSDRANRDLPKDRVFFVEGITRAVQKLYDIASLKR